MGEQGPVGAVTYYGYQRHAAMVTSSTYEEIPGAAVKFTITGTANKNVDAIAIGAVWGDGGPAVCRFHVVLDSGVGVDEAFRFDSQPRVHLNASTSTTVSLAQRWQGVAPGPHTVKVLLSRLSGTGRCYMAVDEVMRLFVTVGSPDYVDVE